MKRIVRKQSHRRIPWAWHKMNRSKIVELYFDLAISLVMFKVACANVFA